MKRVLFLCLILLALYAPSAQGGSLEDIRKRGELRHLGVPYARFISGGGDGLDVELIKRFASYLGVRYVYVPTDWDNLIPDLLGKKLTPTVDGPKSVGKHPVKGDLIASGLTVLDWRKKLLDFSTPTFSTQVWLVSRTNSPLHPITPTESEREDIESTKKITAGKTLLGRPGTCLDPNLYGLEKYGAKIIAFDGNLNDLVPALLSDRSELILLDVPDVLVGLASWPGQIKVLGPVSPRQDMAVGFPKGSDLLAVFEKFFSKLRNDGEYSIMLEKYYPSIKDFS